MDAIYSETDVTVLKALPKINLNMHSIVHPYFYCCNNRDTIYDEEH
jgi:hypothetical protein